MTVNFLRAEDDEVEVICMAIADIKEHCRNIRTINIHDYEIGVDGLFSKLRGIIADLIASYGEQLK